jgi:hypothetical protein
MEAGVALSGVRVSANNRLRCRERCGVFALSRAGVKTCGVREERGTDSKKAVGGFEEKWNVCQDWVLPVADFGRVFFHS